MRVAALSLLPLLACLLTTSLSAQTENKTDSKPEPAATFHAADGGVSGAMESIFIPPLASAPFTFTLLTEWSRPLGNGGTFTLTNQRRIARNLKGQIYQERWFLVPKGGRIASTMTTIQITDPAQHTWLNCWVSTKSCEILNYGLLTTMSYPPAIGATGRLASGNGFHQHEDLGSSRTLGLDTTGYRETTTINPGVLGNDQPMITSREFWYSLRLGLNLVSIVDDPRSGKQVFTATDLTTSEPDPTLFNTPEGYTVVDRRSQQAGKQ